LNFSNPLGEKEKKGSGAFFQGDSKTKPAGQKISVNLRSLV
jgi:hypothetical protein